MSHWQLLLQAAADAGSRDALEHCQCWGLTSLRRCGGLGLRLWIWGSREPVGGSDSDGVLSVSPDVVAMSHGDEQMTYREFDAAVESVGAVVGGVWCGAG